MKPELEVTPDVEQGEKPRVAEVGIRICEDCLQLKGEMCHNAECVFCRRTMAEVGDYLDALLIAPIVDGERVFLPVNSTPADEMARLRTTVEKMLADSATDGAAITALSKALTAAVHAMRSYQHGNGSSDLADEIDAAARAALALVDGPQQEME